MLDELKIKESLCALIARYPALRSVKDDVYACFQMLYECYKSGGKLLCCGNGGSASDSEHIVGELMKCFKRKRPLDLEYARRLKEYGDEGAALAEKLEGSLPAIALVGHTALSTAFGNDKDPFMTFAQQVSGYGVEGDVLLCLTTSGNSKNILRAAEVARGLGLTVIALTGEGGGNLARLADVTLAVPERETYRVQELHLPIYHWLCAEVEAHFFVE